MNVNRTPQNPVAVLASQGQTVWLEDISRTLIHRGKLKALIAEHGLRGMTSNLTRIKEALETSSVYNAQLKRLLGQGKDGLALFEALTIKDVQDACRVFQDVYSQTQGADGFVSIGVSPSAAHDTDAIVQETRWLWQTVSRPNLMVEVPGTFQGIRAVKQLLSEGININITLLFSIQDYERVMWTYLEALETRLAARQPIDQLASVASFCVSGVDALLDRLLQEKLSSIQVESKREQLRALFGKTGIAHAKLAYARFQEIFTGERFARLKAQGARIQRPLWASTGTKEGDYPDLMYVEALIGPDTVTTLPMKTLMMFQDHGRVRRTIDANLDQARGIMYALRDQGIDFSMVTRQLEADSLQRFSASYDAVLIAIDKKCLALERVAQRRPNTRR